MDTKDLRSNRRRLLQLGLAGAALGGLLPGLSVRAEETEDTPLSREQLRRAFRLDPSTQELLKQAAQETDLKTREQVVGDLLGALERGDVLQAALDTIVKNKTLGKVLVNEVERNWPEEQARLRIDIYVVVEVVVDIWLLPCWLIVLIWVIVTVYIIED